MTMHRRAWVPFLAVVLAGSGGCGEAPDGVDEIGNALSGYDLTASYAGPIGNTRGWQIEWQVPALNNPAQAWTAIGEWYYNLESGLYHSPDGWFVYYFGDDNGTAGNEPNCNLQWGTGGTCGGPFANLQAGQKVTFRYEWCTTAHKASVNGSQLCLYVDLHDAHGLRFLAEDGRTTVEMYTHDVEDFGGTTFAAPIIPCSAPIKMLKQRLKKTTGSWVDMSGASTWQMNTAAPEYEYQHLRLSSSPATWEACSTGT
jgi:hypothetical protein